MHLLVMREKANTLMPQCLATTTCNTNVSHIPTRHFPLPHHHHCLRPPYLYSGLYNTSSIHHTPIAHTTTPIIFLPNTQILGTLPHNDLCLFSITPYFTLMTVPSPPRSIPYSIITSTLPFPRVVILIPTLPVSNPQTSRNPHQTYLRHSAHPDGIHPENPQQV